MKKTKKKPKMGRVVLNFGYVVDLNNQEMVDHAKDCLFEDVCSAIKYDEVADWIDVVDDPNATPEEIPEFLLEEEED